MTRESARRLVAGIAAVGVVALALWLLLGRSRPETAETPAAAGQRSAVASAGATLYFPGPGGRLAGEARELPVAELAEDRVRLVVEALLAGPETPGLFAPLPDGIEVGSVVLAVDGTVFLDLVTSEGAPDLSWGSRHELLTVYSLVNSVLANEPQTRRLALLWNGQQRPTFAGHVDLTRPLTLDSGLIAQASGES